jgi:glucose/sorbosone dehydrogenase
MRCPRVCLAASLSLLVLAAPAHAAPSLVSLGTFETPTYAAAPASDPSRVFVTEKAGRVRLIVDGTVQVAPFIDLTSIVRSSDSERGLLSIAFAPDYATSGTFYVYLTAKSPVGEIQVWQYQRSAADPNLADAGSGRLLIAIPHTDAANHNGGTVQVTADGKVWLATGDGGGGDNQYGHSQDPSSRLGKLLRLDPGVAGTPPVEQLAQGLRNPFRFSFTPDGTIVIADVGQGAYEEIDVGAAANYGWPCREGLHAYLTDPGCDHATTADPVLEKSHSGDGFCAIVGGYVVRDPGLPTLLGRYVYGDNCNQGLRSVDLAAPSGDAPAGISVPVLAGVGEDACGRLLVVSLAGPVSRVVDGAATPCGGVTPTPSATASPTPDVTATPFGQPSPTPTAIATAPRVFPVADVRPCAVSIRVTGVHSLGRRGYLSVALRTDEACGATVSARGFRATTARLVPGKRLVVKLRRTTSRSRSVAVRVDARDAAGNVRTLNRSVRVH